MTTHPERAEDYLTHIQTAIARIRTYTEDIDYVGFIGNTMKQDAVIRNF